MTNHHDSIEADPEGLQRDDDKAPLSLFKVEEEVEGHAQTGRSSICITVHRYRAHAVWEIAFNEILLPLALEGLIPEDPFKVDITFKFVPAKRDRDYVEVEIIED